MLATSSSLTLLKAVQPKTVALIFHSIRFKYGSILIQPGWLILVDWESRTYDYYWKADIMTFSTYCNITYPHVSTKHPPPIFNSCCHVACFGCSNDLQWTYEWSQKELWCTGNYMDSNIRRMQYCLSERIRRDMVQDMDWLIGNGERNCPRRWGDGECLLCNEMN